jgi:hypothetical protein
MTNLVARENFVQDLSDFRREFDQIFNRFLYALLSEDCRAGLPEETGWPGSLCGPERFGCDAPASFVCPR